MLRVDPTKRFSSRVDNYQLYRPTYPQEIIEILREECGLTTDFVIADIASGTGIFTRLLLDNHNRVFGIEPNAEMRHAGEKYLREFENFTSVDATAEATTLPDRGVDMITCAQAAHWLDREKSLIEFQRVLKPSGFLVLVWNQRQFDGSGFDRDYEELVLEYGTDYREVRRRGRASEGESFFAPFKCKLRVVSNYQELDYPSLEGRLLSSSYAPESAEPLHAPMLSGLRRIFKKHQEDGRIRMGYDTKIFFGRLNSRD